MKKTSIGTWAYNVGPYGENPIPFDTVGETLSKLKFDGLELGGFNGYPNPHNHPEKEIDFLDSYQISPRNQLCESHHISYSHCHPCIRIVQ